MKRIFICILLGSLLAACSDKDEVLVPIPDDITLNELTLDKFTHVVPDGGFDSKGVHFNTQKGSNGEFSGFAYSRRSNRSFTFTGTQQAIDSNRFSVYTTRPNQTVVYAVACAKNEDAYFTLDKATVVEHVLVANTTWSYLAMNYGEKSDNIANPNIPAAPKGIWYSYAPGVTRKLNQNGDYFKLVIKGYLGNQQTGTVDFYLCCRKDADPANPSFSFLRTDWIKADLTALGKVDKVVFTVDCSYKDENGNSLIPPYFCLDGIRLQK